MVENILSWASRNKHGPAPEPDHMLQAPVDQVDFADLYRSHVTAVYRYLFIRTGNEQDAQDLTAQPVLDLLFVRLQIVPPPGRGLVINQWVDNAAIESDTSIWSLIPPSAEVQIVRINDSRAEYVEGGWAVFPDAKEAQWLADVSQRRLRWQVGDRRFEIIAAGGSTGSVYFLGQADLIALAESMQ